MQEFTGEEEPEVTDSVEPLKAWRFQNQFSPVPPLNSLSLESLVPKILLHTFFSVAKLSLLSPFGFSSSTTPSKQQTARDTG
ncbi:hypothetical protein EYF80_007527 [Liparis tanakae]|uniref:Uncharacterized protein n=1 Tax=Liparis tanakae TaxID=230148 RepID=A0A4Z2IVY8_9TELE|nr:hypothetical protein EYF80_007527 [Liparis tanakae]